MKTFILEIGPEGIIAGLAGQSLPQSHFKSTDPLWPKQPGLLDPTQLRHLRTTLHAAVMAALDPLLITAAHCQALVVEPPLCPLIVKQLVAEILLQEFKVMSLGFLQASVCMVVGAGTMHGLVTVEHAGLVYVVPVYEYREMTPLIGSAKPSDHDVDEDEMPPALLRKKVLDRLDADARQQIQKHLIPQEWTTNGAWVGASVIATNSKVLHLIPRTKFTGQVYDSLFSW